MNKIDIVIPWVDGSDKKWQKERDQYLVETGQDAGDYRYRGLDNLKYFFRGIEKFAPWINKVFFITWGHLPDFLNPNHPQLEIVYHHEFIPKEFLPTFSSHVIELNMHRIQGLSEQFIYFNDDIFIVDDVEPDDFFKDGLPCDQAEQDYITSDRGRIFPHILLNNVDLLNQNFNKKTQINKHRSLWFSSKYNLKTNFKNFYFMALNNFSGLKWHHLPTPYLKSTLEESWKLYETTLYSTSLNKFRSMTDVNQYVFRNHQLVTGQFRPKNLDKFGKFYNLPFDEKSFHEDMRQKKYKIVCVNDSPDIEDLASLTERIKQTFDKRLPDKSKFEK